MERENAKPMHHKKEKPMLFWFFPTKVGTTPVFEGGLRLLLDA